MFKDAINYNQSLGNMATHQVTNMSGMFSGATNFNQPINFNVYNSNNPPMNVWNTGAVTDMSEMFKDATAFNQAIGNWDTTSVTNMSSMFSGATAFNQSIVTSGNKWNVSQVTNMRTMFANATNFNNTLWNWDVLNVTDMSGMFMGASNYDQQTSWGLNVRNVTTMSDMFNGASAFGTSAFVGDSLTEWVTESVTNMDRMFKSATSFNGNLVPYERYPRPGPINWNVENVTSMVSMFESATAYEGINVYIWAIDNVTLEGFNNMFKNASSLTQTNKDAIYYSWQDRSGYWRDTNWTKPSDWIIRFKYEQYYHMEFSHMQTFSAGPDNDNDWTILTGTSAASLTGDAARGFRMNNSNNPNYPQMGYKVLSFDLEAEIPARNKTITEVRVYDTDGSQGMHYPQGWEVYSSATSGSLGSLKATVGYMGYDGHGPKNPNGVNRPLDSYHATSSEFISEQFLNIKFGYSQNNQQSMVYIGKIEILFK